MLRRRAKHSARKRGTLPRRVRLNDLLGVEQRMSSVFQEESLKREHVGYPTGLARCVLRIDVHEEVVLARRMLLSDRFQLSQGENPDSLS
jgi:hypothetical protein